MEKTTTILVVDDEPTIRYYLERVLKRDGHQVIAVESGEAALECIKTQEFDLALIDLMLKGMSGIEVLSTLRRLWPATPAIILTAHASLKTAVEALRQGAHDYLFKPFATEDLRESVQTALIKRQQELQRLALLSQTASAPPGLREASPSPAHERPVLDSIMPVSAKGDERFLEYLGVIVDVVRHAVTVEGTLVELSPTEFSLLAHLVRESPRVVSAQELVREAQGYESQSWEARDTVRTHIYNIRQKIKTLTGRDLIRTVRGVGYALGE